MMPKKITTIIPTFNRERLLSRAIESVLDQDEKSIEICIYDNASSDATYTSVLNYANKDSRVKYYRHKENIGGLPNFLFGMKQIKTPFFSFLSDDDYLLPGFYKIALSRLEKNTEAAFWAGMTINADETGNIWDIKGGREDAEGIIYPPNSFFFMTGGRSPAWTGTLFRSEMISLHGLIDISLLGPSDLEYYLRLTAKHPFYFERFPAAVFTLNSQSFSATQPMSAFWPGWKGMMEKFSNDSDLTPHFKKRALSALQQDAKKMLFRRGANALAGGRLDFARDAANALAYDCDEQTRAFLLRTLAAACAKIPIFQRIYTSAYKRAEKRIVDSRHELQSTYGHLLRDS